MLFVFGYFPAIFVETDGLYKLNGMVEGGEACWPCSLLVSWGLTNSSIFEEMNVFLWLTVVCIFQTFT